MTVFEERQTGGRLHCVWIHSSDGSDSSRPAQSFQSSSVKGAGQCSVSQTVQSPTPAVTLEKSWRETPNSNLHQSNKSLCSITKNSGIVKAAYCLCASITEMGGGGGTKSAYLYCQHVSYARMHPQPCIGKTIPALERT